MQHSRLKWQKIKEITSGTQVDFSGLGSGSKKANIHYQKQIIIVNLYFFNYKIKCFTFIYTYNFFNILFCVIFNILQNIRLL